MKPILILLLSSLTVFVSSCSNAQDAEHARNADWRITPPPTEEEMSHYRIVRNEANTAYAVQSSNTCWLNEHSWWQNGNTWNTLAEATNDIHADVGSWRKRQHPDKWEPVQIKTNPFTAHVMTNGYFTNITVRWQYQEVRDQWRSYSNQLKSAESFYKTNTDNRIGVFVTRPTMYFDHKLTTNDIELGYRSDGTVIWRVPPEALK